MGILGNLFYLFNSCIGAVGLVASDLDLDYTMNIAQRGSKSKGKAEKHRRPLMGAAVVATVALLALPAAAPAMSWIGQK